MEDLSSVVLEGAMIAGVLETAINSDLPGYVRAIVSDNVRSFDGTRVLIARGSRLVGQYRSGLAIGESRAFVIWTRLVLPDGVSVNLASPATDTLGRSGLSGKVDRHFVQRFGSAILLSVIGAGLDAAVDNSDNQVVIGSSSDAYSIAQAALQGNINIPPTIKIAQGSPVRIFVARDLYFPNAPKSAQPELR
ncbi:MAG: type IV secretion system protein VirB10 [Parvularculaceae bacterium]